MNGMRGIDELDHYELLEVRRSASAVDIDRAYRLAQQTYADGSLAMYSVFEARDAAAIRDRLDEAYRVLADSELRERYDEQLPDDEASMQALAEAVARRGGYANGEAARAGDVDHNGTAGQYADPGSGARHTANGQGALFDEHAEKSAAAAFHDVVEEFDALEDEGGGDFDGVRLRRTRLFRGYELDDISSVTKVSCTHLQNIEDENFAELPADVYVRGFVTAYAKTIGLDPTIVVPSYMARVQGTRNSGQRTRLLSRR